MNAIEITDARFTYKGQAKNGLHGVGLRVPQGQCVLLCGPSGCGKTTLTRLVNGLIPHFFEGEFSSGVTVAGLDVRTTTMAKLSRKVGSVFQNPRTQFFNTDPFGEVVFGMENAGLPVPDILRRGRETVSALSIEPLMGKSIFTLSGGEKQKVAFASVYVSEPEVLVLDEPSSNLDPQSVDELASLIGLCKAQGKTILITEHRLHYLMSIADRVVLMQDGLIARDMPIADFRAMREAERVTAGLRCRSLDDVETTTLPAQPGELRLTAVNLCANYDKIAALRGVSFTANGGEIIAITGRNGAGKSTLAHILCGLHKKHAGQITLGGKALSAKERCRRSYMVMQDVGHQLFSDSVAGECRLGIGTVQDAKIAESLATLGLAGLDDRHPLSLSGGQKQRLAVAVSLVCEKDVLIFDEPSLFRMLCKLSMPAKYGEGGWQFIWNENSPTKIQWDCVKCIYHDIFVKYGVDELTAIFCARDDLIYGDIPGARWARTKTMGRGADTCDFCFYKE